MNTGLQKTIKYSYVAQCLRTQRVKMHDNNNTKAKRGEFPGGPVVRIQCFYCCGLGSIPGQGTKILQATWHCQKNKNKILKSIKGISGLYMF